MMRFVRAAAVSATVLITAACQSPTSASSTLNVDDFVDASVPAQAIATPSTGRTYRVVRGNNQPDDVIPFQYTSTFMITTTINANASDSTVALAFPATITAVAGKVEQASGGIVTPPTNGDVEHYESVLLSSSGSTIAGVGGGVTMVFQIWYSLPNGNKEARVTETISMKDSTTTTPKTFAKDVHVNIAP
jgi:hypothetical protein